MTDLPPAHPQPELLRAEIEKLGELLDRGIKSLEAAVGQEAAKRVYEGSWLQRFHYSDLTLKQRLDYYQRLFDHLERTHR